MTLLFFATTVNYMDRQVLSLTWKDFIAPEFHWDDNDYGTITALFSIIYAMLSASFLPASLWTGWAQRRDTSGQSEYGLQEHAYMHSAAGRQCTSRVMNLQRQWRL